ncbi:MAG TPA: hypothetical protein VIT62_03110 [Lysobacter sp.]
MVRQGLYQMFRDAHEGVLIVDASLFHHSLSQQAPCRPFVNTRPLDGSKMRKWQITGLAFIALAIGICFHLRGDEPAETPEAVMPPTPAEAMSSANARSVPGPSQRHANRRPRTFVTRPLGGRAYSIDQSFEARPGDAEAVISSLLPLAEAGSGAAAFEIYLKVASCRTELDLAHRAAPDTHLDALIPSECLSLPIEQWKNHMSRWLEASADRGFVPAQLTYAADPNAILGDGADMLGNPGGVLRYRQQAMNYLHQAASTGNVEALQKLARSYANGILTERDPVSAYAFQIAASKASKSIVPPELSDALKEKYATGLSAPEIQRATQQGGKIYEDCCSP